MQRWQVRAITDLSVDGNIIDISSSGIVLFRREPAMGVVGSTVWKPS